MIRRLLLVALALIALWSGMAIVSGSRQSAMDIRNSLSPLNLGSLVVLGVGFLCASTAYAVFNSRGAFGPRRRARRELTPGASGRTRAADSLSF